MVVLKYLARFKTLGLEFMDGTITVAAAKAAAETN
jgi:hypothetical protein